MARKYATEKRNEISRWADTLWHPQAVRQRHNSPRLEKFSEQRVRQQHGTVVIFQRHIPAVPSEKGPDSRRRRIRWGQIVPESRAQSYTAVTAVKHQHLAGVSQWKVWMSDMLHIKKKWEKQEINIPGIVCVGMGVVYSYSSLLWQISIKVLVRIQIKLRTQELSLTLTLTVKAFFIILVLREYSAFSP